MKNDDEDLWDLFAYAMVWALIVVMSLHLSPLLWKYRIIDEEVVHRLLAALR